MVDFTLSIPDNLNNWLKDEAAKRCTSKNQLIFSILDRYKHMVETPHQERQCGEDFHVWEGEAPCPGQECMCGKMKWSPIIDV